MTYISFPVVVDPAQLTEEALDYLRDRLPGWRPSHAHVEVILLESHANISAQTRELATDVPRAIFREFGPLVGIPPIDATPAEADTTWTAVDAQGYTIAMGTQLEARVSGDEAVAFEVLADVVIPPGETSTAAGAVRVRALEPGAAVNGYSGELEVIDALGWVESITVDGVAAGGSDGEEDDAYLARLSRELELQSPTPILPADYSTLAMRIPTVGRATHLDGYDPDTDTFDNERMVTVAVVDSDGEPVGSVVRDAVAAMLESMREVNFVVHVIDPTYTPVDVTFGAVAHPDFDPGAVEDAAVAALADYLSPRVWGRPDYGDDSTVPGGWRNETTVRYLEVAAALDRVEGLDYVTALTVDGGTGDVSLAGRVALPRPGTIAGTVTAPTGA